jgi:hypothetical protein
MYVEFEFKSGADMLKVCKIYRPHNMNMTVLWDVALIW